MLTLPRELADVVIINAQDEGVIPTDLPLPEREADMLAGVLACYSLRRQKRSSRQLSAATAAAVRSLTACCRRSGPA